MDLEIHVERETEKQKVIFLAGEVDVYTSPRLKETLIPLTEEAGLTIQVDFSDVIYMDSTGLGVFIRALKSTQWNDSKLQLINVSERILRLFHITGLHEIIDVKSSMRGGQTDGEN